jgi:hypothetical protein
MSRRQALKSISVGAFAGAALTMRPESARGYYANDLIQVGCIGTGGRCRKLMEELGPLSGQKITAV